MSAFLEQRPYVSFHRPSATSMSDKSNTKRQSKSSKSAASGAGSTQKGRRTAPSSIIICDICGQGYSRKDNLRTHQRLHSGEMPYECSYCGQRFRWIGACRAHEARHVRDAGGTSHQGAGSTASSKKEQSSHRSTANRGHQSRRSERNAGHVQATATVGFSSRGGGSGKRQSGNTAYSRSGGGSSQAGIGRNRHSQSATAIVREVDSISIPLVHEPWPGVLDDND